ncbi:MAG: PEF-CTERM sorting domain-containing protein [Spirochaetales bacterium]|nr:PEF-CTERM sorting domain-containing protein [Spirochaetales bacterium]
MKNRKIIVAFVGAFFIVAAMTGLAAASDEQMDIFYDNTDVLVSAPYMLINNGEAHNNLDVKLSDYFSTLLIDHAHELTVTINPVDGGAAVDNIHIYITERGDDRSVDGTSPLTLTWYQDHAGGQGASCFDYIDVTLVSDGPNGANYQIVIDDVAYDENNPWISLDASNEDLQLTNVPEFATIAIPVAAILGLVLFFNHRKRKKE